MTLWTILVCVLTQSATCYDNVEQAQEVSAQKSSTPARS